MKTRQLIILLAAVAILIGGYFGMKGLGGMRTPPAQKKAKTAQKFVDTRTVKYEKSETQIRAFGRTGSAQPLDLMSEVPGRLLRGSVPLKEGQNFSAGALLFKVDDEEARLALKAAKSSFMRDVAGILPDFKIDFSGSYPAWDRYFTAMDVNKTMPDLPAAASAKEKTYLAVKNIYSTYYNIKKTEANLKKFTYRAPFGGTITEITLEVGSYVNPGGKIGRAIRSGKLELRVPVEVNNVKWVKVGTNVKISTEDGSSDWDGKVIRIGDVVNPKTQALDVFVSIIPNANKVYDGMYLGMTAEGEVVESAMSVPRRALFNNDRVYLLQDSTLVEKEVIIKKLNQETALISGLPAGSELVIEPVLNIKSDTRLASLKSAQKPSEKSAESAD